MISIALSICLFMATPGYSFNCYTTDPVEEIQTCRADRELCFTVASIEDNNPEKCVYLRGCVKDQLQFPDKASLKYLVKEQNPNGLFQVCDTEKCNNKKPPCIPKNYPKIVANLTDLLKNKTKMWEDESKKVANLSDLLNKINCTKEEPAKEDNGKTNAAGSSVNGLSIGLMVLCGFLVGIIIGAYFFHRREKTKWCHKQVSTEASGCKTSSKDQVNTLPLTQKDLNTEAPSSKDQDNTRLLSDSRHNVKDNTAPTSSRDQES